jgi:hypothetical protein
MKSAKQKDKSEKWKPKNRWIKSITINLDKPGKAKYKYYTPKSPEEEKMMEDDFNGKMEEIFDIIFPEGIYKAMENFRHSRKLK